MRVRMLMRVTAMGVRRVGAAIGAETADRGVLHVQLETRLPQQPVVELVEIGWRNVDSRPAVLAYHVIVPVMGIGDLVVADPTADHLVQEVQALQQRHRSVDRRLVYRWIALGEPTVDVLHANVAFRLRDGGQHHDPLWSQAVPGIPYGPYGVWRIEHGLIAIDCNKLLA